MSPSFLQDVFCRNDRQHIFDPTGSNTNITIPEQIEQNEVGLLRLRMSRSFPQDLSRAVARFSWGPVPGKHRQCNPIRNIILYGTFSFQLGRIRLQSPIGSMKNRFFRSARGFSPSWIEKCCRRINWVKYDYNHRSDRYNTFFDPIGDCKGPY